MILAPGEKLFIMTRRQYPEDLRRHFVGEVEELSGATLRARGYTFVYDEDEHDFLKREDLRTRLFALIDGSVMVFVLPKDVVLMDMHYEIRQGARYITDGRTFWMNISELTAKL